jgi:uncharacterized damage-inducible protein DinB
MNCRTGTEKLVEQTLWAGKNMVYNLDFIPDDKLDWKPEKTANSALELVNHMTRSFDWAKSTVSGKESKSKTVKTKAEAKKVLLKATEDFAEFLKSLSEKDLAKSFSLPWGEATAEFILSLAVIDIIHHRGQLLYIQTLLGDTEDHYQM